jgi:hypothetical protein
VVIPAIYALVKGARLRSVRPLVTPVAAEG